MNDKKGKRKKTNGLKDKVYFITGASRGIGKAIALHLAAEGAIIVVAAKTTEESDARLPGTIYATAREIEENGGKALAVPLDVRDEQQIKAAIAETIERFGRLDGIINNAGALYMSSLDSTRMKDHDLMHAVNTRAVDVLIQESLPWLKLSDNPRILNISPPIELHPGWLSFGYTRSKYAMSMATIGYAEQLKQYGIAVNSLWPQTAVDTSAVRNKLGGDATAALSRRPECVALAAHLVLTKPKEITGQFFIDSQVIKSSGVKNVSRFRVDRKQPLLLDFFIGNPPQGKDGALSRVVWPDKNGWLPEETVAHMDGENTEMVVLASEEGVYAVVKVTQEAQRYEGLIELSQLVAEQFKLDKHMTQITKLPGRKKATYLLALSSL